MTVNSQFQVGTVVARYRGSRVAYTVPARDKVLKVYKNGNFVLESDPRQQFRPSYNGETATETGRGYYRAYCRIWDGEVEKEIARERNRRQTNERVHKFKSWLDSRKNLRGDYYLDDEQLDLLDKVMSLNTGD